MKHHAQQFEIPGTGDTFNLAGEVMRQPEPTTSKPDPEQDGLFTSATCGAFAPVVWGNGTTGLRCRICGQPEGAHK